MNSEEKQRFCTGCGEKLLQGSSYCSTCGKKVEEQEGLQEIEWNGERRRASEEDFRIRRCPACGEGIPSFVAICPACGNELHSTNDEDVVREFALEVKRYEEEISANERIKDAGWNSWGIVIKIGFVILSLIFWLIPVAIYIIWWFYSLKQEPELKEEERNLTATIENFTIPNERDSILKALIYMKEKADFISKERLSQKSYFWLNLWAWKAEQIKQRADIMFADDEIVKQSYEEILKDKKKLDKKIRARLKFLGILLILLSLVWFWKSGYVENYIKRRTVLEIPKAGLGRLIPEIPGGRGDVGYDYENGLGVNYYDVSKEEFEAYKEACKKKGFIVDLKDVYLGFEAYNEQGYKIEVRNYDGEMSIRVENRIEMGDLIWPKTEIVNLIPKPNSDFGKIDEHSERYLYLYIGNTTKKEYQEYINRCIEYGFNQKISQREDGGFFAENGKGYDLRVRYPGFNTMVIVMHKMEEKE